MMLLPREFAYVKDTCLVDQQQLQAWLTQHTTLLPKEKLWTYIARRMEDEEAAANKHTKHQTAFFSGSLCNLDSVTTYYFT